MTTVLITGGRAPVALDLARKFKRQGWHVLVAESMPVHLCQSSNAVDKSFTVPPSRFDADAYIAALQQIIEQENVDLLLPTCEEVFTIGMAHRQLSQNCIVFTEPLERLLPLHSKIQFIELAQSYNLPVPKTRVIVQQAECTQYLGQSVVLKPEFSRFATSTIMNPQSEKDIKTVQVSDKRRWLVQDYIAGRQICTYSVAQQGSIKAHVAYATEITAGKGASIAFEPLHHPQTETWVEKFVACYGFTGQIAFDFIETASGDVYAIECNPRAISGVHLFDDSLVCAITHTGHSFPNGHPRFAVRLAVLAYGWKTSASLWKWLKTLVNSQDVIFSWSDMPPFFTQFAMLWHAFKLSRREQFSLIEASTYDIEWNERLEASNYVYQDS